jgi:AcrR family transcriptional regulator
MQLERGPELADDAPMAGGSPEPKRRDAALTRARILSAAQDAFAQHGYSGVGIREIAPKAGVASSLLLRYFGSKAELFEEALVSAFYSKGFFVRDRETFGRQMAEFILAEGDAPMLAMVLQANADPAAREIARRATQRHMLDALAEWLGPPNGQTRALSMLALMTGFYVHLHQLSHGPAPQESAEWLARRLQELVDDVG